MPTEGDVLSAQELFARSEEIMKWFHWVKVPPASVVNTHDMNFQAPINRLRQLSGLIESAKSKAIDVNERITLLYEPQPIVTSGSGRVVSKIENPPFTREYMQAVSEQLAKMGARVPAGENWSSVPLGDVTHKLLPTNDGRVFLEINAFSDKPVTGISLVIKPKV